MVRATPKRAARILVVDDDPGLLRLLTIRLRSEKYEVAPAENAASALSVIAGFRPDLVVTDLRMAQMDGLALLKELQAPLAQPQRDRADRARHDPGRRPGHAVRGVCVSHQARGEGATARRGAARPQDLGLRRDDRRLDRRVRDAQPAGRERARERATGGGERCAGADHRRSRHRARTARKSDPPRQRPPRRPAGGPRLRLPASRCGRQPTPRGRARAGARRHVAAERRRGTARCAAGRAAGDARSPCTAAATDRDRRPAVRRPRQATTRCRRNFSTA